jgi:hypothetical protein
MSNTTPKIQVSPTNILSVASGTTSDFLCASFVAGTIDWMFHFIPMGEGTIFSTIISLLQLSIATAFTYALRGYMGGKGATVHFYLPIFIWNWSPNAAIHLQKSYRVFQRAVMGINNEPPQTNP